jgi:hypothetical protein
MTDSAVVLAKSGEYQFFYLAYCFLNLLSHCSSHTLTHFEYVGICVEKTKVAEITSGRVDFELSVRVINMWTTPDRVNPTDVGAIHMIFLDKDVCLDFYP